MDLTQQELMRTENLVTTVSSDGAACDLSESSHIQAPENGQTRNEDSGKGFIGKTSEELRASSKPEEDNRNNDQYSAYTVLQKRWIVSLGASVGWFSTSSSFIFFPIIPFLARDLHESTERINLTVTSYLVASGVFPSIIAGLSDVYGRKPVFVTALGAYVAVNIGLALQRSFAVLLGLRLLQAAAISCTYMICLAVSLFQKQTLILIWTPYEKPPLRFHTVCSGTLLLPLKEENTLVSCPFCKLYSSLIIT